MGIQSLSGSQINDALKLQYRVYLCGDKSMIQPSLEYIPDEQLEVGISDYQEYTADKPHYHAQNTEYNYVVCGCTKVIDLDTGEELQYEAGSLFVLAPNTRYASKHIAGTKMFFVKCPKGNDKIIVNIDNKLSAWMKSWDAPYGT